MKRLHVPHQKNWAGSFCFWCPYHDHDLVRLGQLGLLDNESQLLKWRLSLCRSSENILYQKGEHVPKSTEQFLCASSFFISKASAWSLVERRHMEFCQVGLFVCPCVCVVLLQNENFEGKDRRRPWVNRNSLSNEKNFLRSLGLLGNESQFLKWRLSLCRSSENILYHLKGENVPKSTLTFTYAGSFLDWGLFKWSSLKFTDEFCLLAWLCFFLFRKHRDFCQTGLNLRGYILWGQILLHRFLNLTEDN